MNKRDRYSGVKSEPLQVKLVDMQFLGTIPIIREQKGFDIDKSVDINQLSLIIPQIRLSFKSETGHKHRSKLVELWSR